MPTIHHRRDRNAVLGDMRMVGNSLLLKRVKLK
jgi:hypothetical protein